MTTELLILSKAIQKFCNAVQSRFSPVNASAENGDDLVNVIRPLIELLSPNQRERLLK